MMLHDRIRLYVSNVTADGSYVTQEKILSLAKSKGYSTWDTLNACNKVHRMKDIESKTHKGVIVYRLRRIKQASFLDKYVPTAEEVAEWNEDVRAFFMESPLATDEERQCHIDGWKSEECKTLLMSPAEKRLRDVKKYGTAKEKRLREEASLVD